MSNQPIDKQKIMNALLHAAGGKIDKKSVLSAAKGDLTGVMGALSDDDRKKLLATLSDKEQLKKILDSPDTRDALNKLNGER